MMKLKKLPSQSLGWAVLAVLSAWGLGVYLGIPTPSGIPLLALAENLCCGLTDSGFRDALWIPLLFLLYRSAAAVEKRICRPLAVCAGLFGVMMLLGQNIAATDDLSLIFTLQSGQPVKLLMKLLGYGSCFYCLGVHFRRLQAAPAGEASGLLGRHPFLVSFVLLTLVYIPIALMYYPSVFMEDSNQLLQMYPELGVVVPDYLEGRLLDSAVLLNQHHPVAHTLLLYGFVQLGRALGSADTGLFLYSCFQGLTVIAAMSWSVHVAIRWGKCSAAAGWLMLLFYALCPRIQNYMFLMTKDVLYAACCLALLCCLFRVLRGCGGRANTIIGLLSALGIFLFRNEGRYLLLALALLLLLLNRANRRMWISLAAGTLVVTILWSVGCTALSITPGSRREMLSVPAQMVARCLRDVPESLSEADKEVINAVFETENMAANYEPGISDQAKGCFREDASTGDVLRFLGVWLKLMVKNPAVCLQAWLANYGENFYISATPMRLYSYDFDLMCMNIMNDYVEPLGFSFSLGPVSGEAKYTYETIREKLAALPGVSLLSQPAFYNWMLLLCAMFCLLRRDRASFCLTLLPLLLLAICLISPANALYGRYEFSGLLLAPAVWLLSAGKKANDGISPL